ncbi:hypothetical protein B0O99DRAFT_551159 [Bisporella sp. PMI_857]|nr:hypothetical protein B0O99DRAFT_551159 [Bisporella sp. PMI_857]
MLSESLAKVGLFSFLLGNILATPARLHSRQGHAHHHHHHHESLPIPTEFRISPDPIKPVSVDINGVTVSTNTSEIAAAPAPAAQKRLAAAISVKATVLILARDTASAYSAYSGLNGYGIPYQIIVVPKAGTTLPTLSSSATTGNYGAIVISSEVSYDYGGTIGFQSAITSAQWTEIYQYQVTFGVRLVRIDVFPGPSSGTYAIGGCCDGVEQLIQISNTTAFPSAGLKAGAGLSTEGLWHYPAGISDPTIASEFATFGPATGFPTTSTAGVINNISGRQQLVFFIGFATEWSTTSTFLQHAWIHWATRGLYTGYRRINLNTQVDDMFLDSDIYYPGGMVYQVTTPDLDQHKTWSTSVNSRLPAGSNYFIEIGHNGNGNIINSAEIAEFACGIGPIDYDEQPSTPLEFVKPPGTGTSIWPATPVNYPYSETCLDLDSHKTWWTTPSNLNAFAHVSHTFTHEDLNNATYFDAFQEITWNQRWFAQTGIANANMFSAKGLIPPAITGLHNADALRAWATNGITQVIGDNTRPALLDQQNEHWPLITTVADNGYAGIQITPRWSTNIYYNCHLPECTVREWIATSAGSGDWYDLLKLEKNANTRHLLQLRHDPYMFHQANLNYVTAGMTTINGVTSKLSLFQAWVETITQEMVRLTHWPIISRKHGDFSTDFANRRKRDLCAPVLTYSTDSSAQTITGITLQANGNACDTEIPVTVPGSVTNTQGYRTEQVGNDPLTIWVGLSGAPVSFTLSTPIVL